MEAALIQSGAERDLRVDFFRGIALWWIFVDHIPDNWVAQFSLRNFALCDSTEVFVLLAGFAAGTAYGRTLDRQGWLYAGADVMRRAWTLYVAHIFLFVVFSAQVSYSATALDRSDYLDEIHLDVLAEAPYRAMLEALMLTFQPAYMNILPMYIVLLCLFALALPLIRWPRILLGVSFAIYLVVRITGWNLPSWTGGGWYFNPFAWQVLFAIGAALSRTPFRPVVGRRVLDALALSMVAIGAAMIWLVAPNEALQARVPPVLAKALLSVDKEALHPLRLLSILALTWLASRAIPFGSWWLRSRAAFAPILCGQHSLPVFCVGIFLSFLGRLAMEERGYSWEMQLTVNLVGTLGLFGIAALAAWYRDKGRAARSHPVALEAKRV